jgi:hypothetical protein
MNNFHNQCNEQNILKIKVTTQFKILTKVQSLGMGKIHIFEIERLNSPF